MPFLAPILTTVVATTVASGLTQALQPHGGSQQPPFDPSDILNPEGSGSFP